MKYILASIAALAISCTANPPILPEPSNATTGVGGFGGNGGAGGMDASSSIASSSASGSSGSPLPGDGSGTRLKRYVYTSADGAIVSTASFYDALLGIDCYVLDSPVGKRCMQIGSASGSVFSDSACTISAIATKKGCQVSAYAYSLTTVVDTCLPTNTFRIFTVGPMQPTGFYVSGNTCKPFTAAELTTVDIRALGPEVDYSQFAAITLEHE